MSTDVLMIKNMVCRRCILAVEQILKDQRISYGEVLIGEIHLPDKISLSQTSALQQSLEHIGFELIDNRQSALIEKIKQHVIKRARNQVSEEERATRLSDYLSAKLHHEYTYISSLFSAIEGRTIEHYFIEQRIENVKELLVYGELTLSQIAMELEYSSTAHLSAQFKKVTGLTPTYFRQLGAEKRKAIDKV